MFFSWLVMSRNVGTWYRMVEDNLHDHMYEYFFEGLSKQFSCVFEKIGPEYFENLDNNHTDQY